MVVVAAAVAVERRERRCSSYISIYNQLLLSTQLAPRPGGKDCAGKTSAANLFRLGHSSRQDLCPALPHPALPCPTLPERSCKV